jgi:TldD protein
MSEFEAATAAVQAALDAGASYADARVMHRRTESMDARNGEIEELNQVEDAGVGVRALVGSSWGFFALPDLSDAAARTAGAKAAAIAVASASVPGPPRADSGAGGQRHLVIGVRGRPARGAPVRQGRFVGIDHGDDARGGC